MNVSALSNSSLQKAVSSQGLLIEVKPFWIKVQTAIPDVITGIKTLYADHTIGTKADTLSDFHIRITRPRNHRRWFRPQALFFLDNQIPFKPLPLAQAFPFFEWGLNWCISQHIHTYLILHAAVIEKNGLAAILPSPPEAGKSTLCAGLVSRGWRLLSDELTLISPETGRITPLPRPVSLKNESIGIIQHFAPRATYGPICQDTNKGNVAHMKPPTDSVLRADETAEPAWIVIPRYHREASTRLEPRSKGLTMMFVVENSFNYSYLGADGFHTAAGLIDKCRCYDFEYSDLEEAVQVFDSLV